MTGKKFLQEKYPKQLGGVLWNTNENIDDNWVAQMLEEYHESKVKQLNLAFVTQRSELLLAFCKWAGKNTPSCSAVPFKKLVKSFLKANNCG